MTLDVADHVADAVTVARFWAVLLGRDLVEESVGALVPGDETQVGLRFVPAAGEQVGPRLLHLHLTSETAADQQEIVEEVLRLGGRHLDVGQQPDDGFVVMADPGGNPLCVIAPGNSFLAGTGRLGEVASEGTREVGLFWRDTLGWPLVWDEDGETAVQSPRGGTKIAWGGPPVAPRHGSNRQRFELVADDLAAETERLVGLGATRLGATCLGATRLDVELADVDGNAFNLLAT